MDKARRRLATQVLVAAFKVVLPEVSTRVDGVAELGRLLGEQRSTGQSHAEIVRQLRTSLTTLENKLSIDERMAGGDSPDDGTAVVELVTESVAAADLSLQVLLAARLDPTRLTEMLWPACRERLRGSLVAEASEGRAHRFLYAACALVIGLVREGPSFGVDLAYETHLRLEDGLAQLLRARAEATVMPVLRRGTSEEAAKFEAGYRSDLIASYSQLEVFGIDVAAPLRRRPIDTAYFSLKVERRTRRSALARDLPDEDAVASPPQPPLARRTTGSEGDAERVEAALERLAHDLRGGQRQLRLLITGRAGAGKSTLARWLTVQAARKTPADGLASFVDRVPFLVPLRDVFRGRRRGIPDLDALMSSSAGRLTRPGDWLPSVLESRPSLVILDGLDEVPDHRRTDFWAWTDDLLQRYSRTWLVVTSRPGEVDPVAFTNRQFTEFAIQPMEPRDSIACIDQWFRAATSLEPGVLVHRHEDDRRRLVSHVQTRPAIRNLAQTPLLCAMLCAYYCEFSDEMPRSRKEVYEGVVAALVYKRDLARGAPEGVEYDPKLKLASLENLALAMRMASRESALIRTGKGRGIGRDDDVALTWAVREAQQTVPNSSVDTDGLVDHLIRRSVVLVKVTDREVAFAHRSLMEFLAARAMASRGDFVSLSARLFDPAWREVAVFACGAASRRDASSIIDQLVREAGEPSRRSAQRDLLLLAAECAGAAQGIEAKTLRVLRARLRDILPPKSMHEVETLAAFGEDILPFLGHDPSMSVQDATFSVRAAAAIGGGAALSVLRGYAQSPLGERLSPVLQEGWGNFDRTEYVDRVLDNLSFTHHPLRLATPDQIQAARGLSSVEWVQLTGVGEVIPSLEGLSGVRALSVGRPLRTETLDGLRSCPGLERLEVSGQRLRDVRALTRLTRLRQLYLRDVALVDGSAVVLAELRRLAVVSLVDVKGLREAGALSFPHALTLTARDTDLQGLGFLPASRRVRSLDIRTAGAQGYFDVLSGLEALRSLAIRVNVASSDQVRLDGHRGLQRLTLSGAAGPALLGQVAHLPALRYLDVADYSRARVPAWRTSQHCLRELRLGKARGEQVAQLGALPELRELRLHAFADRELPELSGLGVRRMSLVHCDALLDVSALTSLRHLEVLQVDDHLPPATLDAVFDLAHRREFVLDYDYNPVSHVGHASG